MADKDLSKLYTSQNSLGYFEAKNPNMDEGYQFKKWFPVKKIVGLDFSYVKGSGRNRVLITPSAFDVESIILDAGGVEYESGELPLFKNAMQMREKERRDFETYLMAGNRSLITGMMETLFRHDMLLIESSLFTQEYLRAKALSEGAININFNGSVAKIDYGIKSGRKHTIDLTSTSVNPVEALFEIVNATEQSLGWVQNGLLMSSKAYNALRKNSLVKEAIKGSLATTNGTIITNSALEAYVMEITGLKIYKEDRTITLPNGIVDKLLAENKGAVFADEQLGDTLVGVTPSEYDKTALSKIADISTNGDGVTLKKWATIDPVRKMTGVEMVCIPSFPKADKVDLITFTIA